MNNDELEENIFNLIGNLENNKTNFSLDAKAKKILNELTCFKEIFTKYPDKSDFIINELFSDLEIKNYNKHEIIFDNNIKLINHIFIIFLGEINIIKYQNVEENSEQNSGQNLENNDKKDISIKRGDIFGKKFLVKTFKIEKKMNEKGELYEDENIFFKINAKTKTIIGIIMDRNFYNIMEKYNNKEKHERILFLHNLDYLPNEPNFIEKFYKLLIKRCFKKNYIICGQNEEINSVYLIIKGSIRLSIAFNKKFYCSLDYDVLIGKLINERFSSSRLFEINGSYGEKEYMLIMDLGEGEIIGGIELCKNMNKSIFKIECMTEVSVYEITFTHGKNLLETWNLKNFYNKINEQLSFFFFFLESISDYNKKKSQIDDYSLAQNKFIKIYKEAHPLNAKAEEYIKKYTNPFKYGKLTKSKELKIKNTKFSDNIISNIIKDINKSQKLKNKNKSNISNKNYPFITNLIKENYSQALRPQKKRALTSILNINNRKKLRVSESEKNLSQIKENSIKTDDKEDENKIKLVKKNNILKLSTNSGKSSSVSNNNKNNIDIKRINNYKLNNDKKLRKSRNYSNENINSILGNSIIKYKNISHKNNSQKLLHVSSDNINHRKSDVKKEESNATSKKLVNSSMNTQLIPNKSFDLFFNKMRKAAQSSINTKKLTFPYGIQEIDKEGNNMEEIIKKFISNRFIRKEFNLNKINSRYKPILFKHKNTKIPK